jgi:hypothetical protein
MAATSLVAQSASSAAPTLREQLEAQYPLAQITGKNGCTVSNADTAAALVIQKPGVVAVPAGSFAPKCGSNYENGKLKGPGIACTGKKGKFGDFASVIPKVKDHLDKLNQVPERSLTQLDKGDSVYATAIEQTKGEIKVTIGYCSGEGNQAAAYKGVVVFHFKDDVLKSANIMQVEDTIQEVFTQNNAVEPAKGDAGEPTQQDSREPARPEKSAPPNR